MMSIKKISFAIVLSALAFAQSASAAINLYSQSVSAGTTVNSQEAIGGSDRDVFTFATFTATQTGTVDNISWQGTANPLAGYAGFSDGFSIDVLDGAIPLPGSVAYAPVSHTFLASTGLANPVLNANGMYDYNASVQPFYVQAGKTYHISIRANGIAPWGWATGPGTGTIAYVAGVFKFLPSPGIPVYALNNVNNTVVAPPLVNPTAVTIVPVPAPTPTTVVGATGDVQGMVTGIGNGFFTTDTVIGGIHGALVTYDGDTVTTYHGGLVTFAVGEIVNYSYTVDVDGVILAKTVDVYPTEVVDGVGRVAGYTTTNGLFDGRGLGLTSGEVLTGTAVPYIDFYKTASYNQIMSYSGFRNPTTGFVYVTNAKLSALPITAKSVLPSASVGQMFTQNPLDFSLFGQPVNLGSMTASGLPAGLTVQGFSFTGIPTTVGTYTVSLSVYGDLTMLAGALLGKSTTTIVVNPSVITPADTIAPVITMTGTDVTLTAGTSYVDAGATCADNVDTTCAVTTTSAVDTTTAGTYTVNYGATDVAGNIATPVVRTVTVTPVVIVPPTPVSCSATGVITNYPASKFWLDVSIDGLAPVKVNFASQANTTFVSPATTFENGQTVSYTGTYDATGIFCNAQTMIVTPAPVVVIADTIAPVITMNGTDVTLTAGNSYVDASAVCTDNVDATCAVTTTSTVDTTTVGIYTVTYSATDLAGNIAIPVVRTVTVNPAPVVITTTGAGTISSVGRDFLVINGGLNPADHVFYTPTAAGTSFFGNTFMFTTGEYVSFTGIVDGLGAVHATSMSVYPAVTYVNALVNAQATIAYAATNLMVSGTAPFTVSATGVPAGMTVDASGILSGTPTTAGVYSMTLSATDAIGNIGRRILNITVDAAPDTIAPVITMTGTNVTLTAGDVYVDAGATCTDNVDATCAVVTTSTVNTAVAGIYTVTYSATDLAGNVATQVVRTVTVNPAPVITTGAGQITSVGRNFIVINGGLNAADHVFYTPTAAGTTFFGGVTTFLTGEYVTFTGTVDAVGSVSATSMSVYPKVTFVGVLTNAQVGTVYSSTNLLVTGTTPFTVGATGVPTGMSISPTGVLSGTPTTGGTSTITLSATDAIGNTGTGIVTIVVAPAPVVTPPPTYTSTGVKVDAKSTIASYNAASSIMTVANGAVLRITPSTKVILNNGAKLSSVGVRVQYKGVKNTDGTVTVSQIEVN